MNVGRVRKLVTGPALAAVVATGWMGAPQGTVEPAWFTLHVPRVELAVRHIGEVGGGPGEPVVRDAEYWAPGPFPTNINGSDWVTQDIKVASRLRMEDGTGVHQGTIDLVLGTVPGGDLTLEFRGLATQAGTTLRSAGAFEVTRATGAFSGLAPRGHYGVVMEALGGASGPRAYLILAAVGQ